MDTETPKMKMLEQKEGWKPNTTEIIGKTGSQFHRALKTKEEKPVRHVFSSHRSDFHPMQLIYFGTKILFLVKRNIEENFIILGFSVRQICSSGNILVYQFLYAAN